MHPEEETHLKAAFAELRRRQRMQAPDLHQMHQRALLAASELEQGTAGLSLLLPRIAWAVVAVCLLTFGLWWAGFATRAGRLDDRLERADRLIATIEQHLEQTDAAPSLSYPSDLLLAETQPAFWP